MSNSQIYYYVGKDHEILNRCVYYKTRYAFEMYYYLVHEKHTGYIILNIAEDDLIVLNLIGSVKTIERYDMSYRMQEQITNAGY